ncbi:MAG: biotin transporter BioY [Deltaproteobacteria bacterium]|nr:biotin transporter BioY [Deltaproteobacteria bacterium]MBI2501519.1 biotin transporter BioY [Deltaproteobacteria bacterium]
MSSASIRLSSIRSKVFWNSLLAFGFALTVGIGAQLKVFLPGNPVPMTFQTLFLLIGASYLHRFYSLQMAGWYLLLGVAGFPLFANGSSGLNYLFGPTGGYLLGFILAAGLLGFFKPASGWRQLLLFLFAHSIIFIPGLLWLKVVTGASWPQTLQMGLYPFLIGDLLKSAIAFTVSRFYWKP